MPVTTGWYLPLLSCYLGRSVDRQRIVVSSVCLLKMSSYDCVVSAVSLQYYRYIGRSLPRRDSESGLFSVMRFTLLHAVVCR